MSDRFDRQVRFFGSAGQQRLASCRVAIVGVGGVGTHVVQQLAHLGVGHLAVIDSEELDETNRNRYVGSRYDDPVPGTRKVDLAERLIKAIDPHLVVQKVAASVISKQAFGVLQQADVVFGCLDGEGVRLILNEFCAAYERPYIDLATDIIPGTPPIYGGRICTVWDQSGCLMCHGLLDVEEATRDLSGQDSHRDRAAIYGVAITDLDRSGPSVVSINGVVASLGVTEFLVAITGLRPPQAVLTYHGNLGRVSVPVDPPAPDCYYCRLVRGKGDAAGLHRYLSAYTTAPAP